MNNEPETMNHKHENNCNSNRLRRCATFAPQPSQIVRQASSAPFHFDQEITLFVFDRYLPSVQSCFFAMPRPSSSLIVSNPVDLHSCRSPIQPLVCKFVSGQNPGLLHCTHIMFPAWCCLHHFAQCSPSSSITLSACDILIVQLNPCSVLVMVFHCISHGDQLS